MLKPRQIVDKNSMIGIINKVLNENGFDPNVKGTMHLLTVLYHVPLFTFMTGKLV